MNNKQLLQPNTVAEVAIQMLKEMENWPHAELQIRVRKNLQKMFRGYNTLEAAQRKRLDLLIIQHRVYCVREGNDQYTRQHNSFVLHYINGMSYKRIAPIQVIDTRTVAKDIDAVLDRMLIFMLGFYGIRWDKTNPR